MTVPQDDSAARARELQRGWYGEPLGELFRRLIAELGLNQSRLASVLGLSAPMLSQLMRGQRAKIGNPVVTQRLQALTALAARVADGEVGAEEAKARMEEIRQEAGSPVLVTASQSTVVPSDRRVVREIQSLLRALASAEEVLAASHLLAAIHPGLAEFLRVYGAGRTDEAVAHYTAHQE